MKPSTKLLWLLVLGALSALEFLVDWAKLEVAKKITGEDDADEPKD